MTDKTNNQEQMDIVYILGSGSKWDDNEIKYSLRSLKFFEHRNVFVIGEKLDWFSDKIIHIPATDSEMTKFKNARKKLKIAVNDPRISDDFVLMNDDFYFWREVKEIKPYHRGKIRDVVNSLHKKHGNISFIATLRLMGRIHKHGYDYSVHYPFVYNKEKLKKVISDCELYKTNILIRTHYGNLFHRNNPKLQRKDVKIHNYEDIDKVFKDKPEVISTGDHVVLDEKMQKKLKNKFRKKSEYEI